MQKMSKYHIEFDKAIKSIFKDDIELVSCHGPVQMCVLGMEYLYKPNNYKIKIECERGIFVICIENSEGKKWYPDAGYTHDISSNDDVIHFTNIIYDSITNDKVVF